MCTCRARLVSERWHAGRLKMTNACQSCLLVAHNHRQAGQADATVCCKRNKPVLCSCIHGAKAWYSGIYLQLC